MFRRRWFPAHHGDRLVFTNNPSLVKSTEVISGVSDHEAVTITSKLTLPRLKQSKRKIYVWSKADSLKIKTEVGKFAANFLRCSGHLDVDTMWSEIKDNLLEILNKFVPSKLTSSRYFPPWITTQTKRYIRNKQIWYRRAKKSNDPKIWQKYHDYKKLAQKFCRRSHDSYVEGLLNDGRDNHGHTNKKFWSYIK